MVQLQADQRAASPADERFAADLRGFGPVGIVAILAILLTGNIFVYGLIFAATGRIFLLMCAHTAFDLAALAIIYWNLESAVAHLVFK